MPHFIVISEQGPRWDPHRPMRGQDGWTEHASFMDALAEERFVLLGGPLRTPPKHRALLVVDAPDEKVVRERLAEDPWMRSETLVVVEVLPWEVLLGRLSR
jgi:hypothetical protein